MAAPTTLEDFLPFYPQFINVPPVVLNEYIRQANLLPGDVWDEWLPEGRRLYVAHKCTLYLRTTVPDGASNDAVAAAGTAQGTYASKSVGGVSVSYGANAATAGIEGWGDLKETEFGIQFLSIARRLMLGGIYVP